MTSVSLSDVTVILGDTPIISGITTRIYEGRFLGLVGPNGAGKTTLLRTINGRLKPATGRVTLGTDPTTALTARELGQRVATVPQQTTLSFDFTVRDVVELGRHPHRSRFSVRDPGRDRIEWALDHTDTTRFADRPITAVSGGERQRVLLARALAQDTPILLLDEPTANLDITHQIRTLGLVRDLVDRTNKTVIAAIHDLDLAARYCDELLLLTDGGLTATGPPEAVLTEGTIATAFDTPVAVTTNPATGTPTVTAIDEPATARSVTVHVLGGGKRALPVLATLARAGYPVTAGPLHANDPAVETASHLDIPTITAQPYTTFDHDTITAANAQVDAADVTVLTNLEVGWTNRGLLDIAGRSAELVVIETTPFGERNHAGVQAEETYERLRDRAQIVTDPTAVLSALTDITPEPTTPYSYPTD